MKKFIVDKTNELLTMYCYEGLKIAATRWLESLDTEMEKEAAKTYVRELEGAVMDIDTVIHFMESETAITAFGVETAQQYGVHAKDVKANGGVWCDCPACSICLEILEHKEELLK